MQSLLHALQHAGAPVRITADATVAAVRGRLAEELVPSLNEEALFPGPLHSRSAEDRASAAAG